MHGVAFPICRLKGCSSGRTGCLRQPAVSTRRYRVDDVIQWIFMFRQARVRHHGAAMDTES